VLSEITRCDDERARACVCVCVIAHGGQVASAVAAGARSRARDGTRVMISFICLLVPISHDVQLPQTANADRGQLVNADYDPHTAPRARLPAQVRDRKRSPCARVIACAHIQRCVITFACSLVARCDDQGAHRRARRHAAHRRYVHAARWRRLTLSA
jgi:hypothetical protein